MRALTGWQPKGPGLVPDLDRPKYCSAACSEVLLTTCTLRRLPMMPAISLDVIAGVHSPEKSGPLNEVGAVIRPFDYADVAGTRATKVIENGTTAGSEDC
jgi:hypothetical protein